MVNASFPLVRMRMQNRYTYLVLLFPHRKDSIEAVTFYIAANETKSRHQAGFDKLYLCTPHLSQTSMFAITLCLPLNIPGSEFGP